MCAYTNVMLEVRDIHRQRQPILLVIHSIILFLLKIREK